jgi:hypothetical protein
MLGQALRLDDAVQQSSILGRELSDLDLHIVNYGRRLAIFCSVLSR